MSERPNLETAIEAAWDAPWTRSHPATTGETRRRDRRHAGALTVGKLRVAEKMKMAIGM